MFIILEGKQVELQEPTFGKIKKIVSAYSKMSQVMASMKVGLSASIGDDAMEEMGKVIALVIDKTPDEFDNLRVTFKEVSDAIPVIAEHIGLKRTEASAAGEAVATAGVASTLTS